MALTVRRIRRRPGMCLFTLWPELRTNTLGNYAAFGLYLLAMVGMSDPSPQDVCAEPAGKIYIYKYKKEVTDGVDSIIEEPSFSKTCITH